MKDDKEDWEAVSVPLPKGIVPPVKPSFFVELGELILALFRKWSCAHEWEFYYETNEWGLKGKYPTEIHHTMICKKCGKIKRINV